MVSSTHYLMASSHHQKSFESPLLYALLKQKFEVKQKKGSFLKSTVRNISALVLAVGCGVVGATMLDSYLSNKTLSNYGWGGWLLDKFSSVVETTAETVPTVVEGDGAGVKVGAGLRIRSVAEVKGMVTGAAAKAVSVVQQPFQSQPQTVKRKTLFKPLFCLTTIGAYFVCRYLIREQSTPFLDLLTSFVADWKTHKLRTPKEFYWLFDKLDASYQKNHELMISEEVAMMLTRQLITVCTSRITQELGVDDTEANRWNLDYQREAERSEKESSWLGWQLLPTMCKFVAYFFM